jgi:predicted amidophosphoribosyltransferase
MLCPSCSADIPDDLPECANCGLILIKRAAETLEGLERTSHDAAPDVPVERLPGLESTSIVDDQLPLPDEPLEIERTQVTSPEGAAPTWGGGVDIEPTQVRAPQGAGPAWEGTVVGFDRGRESESEPTPASPDQGVCVHCGAPATGVFCEACGHRRAAAERPQAPETKARKDVEAVLCPACFARRPPYHDVALGIDRCGECGLPLPSHDAP